ncbi:MAG: DNA primase [Patescibacteria group bacterium]
MSSTVEQIKARLSIVDVVGNYLKLEKAGANYRTRCPFHQEKSPSFFVSPSRNSYHCFGCNRGGDLISFVEEIENLDFLGALKLLADRAGVPYQTPDPKLASLKDRLYAVLEAATRYYASALAKNEPALAYLKSRGLTDETIKNFRLGWAPDSWRQLGPELLRQGFKTGELVQAGLLVSPPAGTGKSPYDRFRSRIMFPIADSVGRIVGFSGRIFGQTDEETAKYVNSPETPLYDKSSVLYLYDRARGALRLNDRAILVEGQVDAVLSHQAGFGETVAVSGTALTRDHLLLLKRLTNNLIIALDADLAGVNASKKAIELALGLGLEVKIALLPSGQDPAEVIGRDPEEWRRALAAATHVIDFLLRTLKQKFAEPRPLAHAIEREVYPFIARLASPLDQAFFINQIANLLGLEETVIREGVKKVSNESNQSDRPNSPSAATVEPPPAPPNRRERLAEIILGITFWSSDPELKKMVEGRLGEELLAEFELKYAPRRAALGLAAEVAYQASTKLIAELSELLDYWQEENWREELNQLLLKVRQLGTAPPETIGPLLTRCQELSEKINNLKKI